MDINTKGRLRLVEQILPIDSKLKYWQLVRIDSTGNYKTKEMTTAKVFLQQQLPHSVGADVSESLIQHRLMSIMQKTSGDRQLAELCLRCFISHQIQQVCIRLEAQFGYSHGFSRTDLFRFVLDDDGTPQANSYQSVATKILQTFDPKRGSLASWTTRLVKHHPELNQFLLERGVYLISDWAILNDTSTSQLQRILTSYCCLAPAEVQLANVLLESYHAVYRQDRIQQRRLASIQGREQCQPPTDIQMHRIVKLVNAQVDVGLKPVSAQNLLMKLQSLAERLRQYRVDARRGFRSTVSLDRQTTRPLIECIPASGNDEADRAEQFEFLQFYRQQLVASLDRAIEQTLGDRYTSLRCRDGHKAEQFVQALQQFYCLRLSMGEIARKVGLKAQFEVSRLLKLKQLRADIGAQTLKILHSCISDKARAYAQPEKLDLLDSQLELVLEEQISKLMQDAEREASIPNHSQFQSLFAQRLCHYLDVVFGNGQGVFGQEAFPDLETQVA